MLFDVIMFQIKFQILYLLRQKNKCILQMFLIKIPFPSLLSCLQFAFALLTYLHFSSPSLYLYQNRQYWDIMHD